MKKIQSLLVCLIILISLVVGSLRFLCFLYPNDYELTVKKYAKMGRIHFAHVRNIKILEDGSFEESAHMSACGSLDIVEILKAYHDAGFKGYLRPDHGRMIWGETGKPGYGLYDRALGAMYMAGIWETLDKIK